MTQAELNENAVNHVMALELTMYEMYKDRPLTLDAIEKIFDDLRDFIDPDADEE